MIVMIVRLLWAPHTIFALHARGKGVGDAWMRSVLLPRGMQRPQCTQMAGPSAPAPWTGVSRERRQGRWREHGLAC